VATLRVVLDTNVLLSGIAYPASVPGKILAAWRHGSVDVLLSAYILDELRRVLPRLAHRHGLTSAEIDDLVDALSIQAEVIEPLPDLVAHESLPRFGCADEAPGGDRSALVRDRSHPLWSGRDDHALRSDQHLF
jgi:putative PIN family toxin of toxin-antitoxin system